jgi:prohibitin 2
MYVCMSSVLDTEINLGKTKKYIVPVIVLGIIIFVLVQSVAFVPAGHRGVFMTFGAVDESRSVNEGIVFKTPFADTVLPVEIRKRIYTDDTAAASRDLQDVTTQIAIEYTIDSTAVQKLWKFIGADYERRIISPAINEITKQVTARYDAEELVTKRSEVKNDIQEGIKERLAENYLLMTQLSVTDFKFSPLFTQAIESKVEAQQKALQAENDLRRIEVEAQQNEAQAVGEANANAARADGEAAAILTIDNALLQSPTYMEWLKTQKWNGVLPLVTGDGATPFINIPSGSAQQ